VIPRIFQSALLAGLLAGLCISLVQAVITTPMILEAETYEVALPTLEAPPVCGPEQEDCNTGLNVWQPREGFERYLFTALANVGAGVGFSLLLLAGMALRGAATSARVGLMWGVGGYAVFTLAPALGLPPELPAVPTVDVAMRQVWWAFAVAGAGAGLSALSFAKTAWVRGLGVVLFVLPHAIGAPHGPALTSSIPPDLVARFAAASIAVNAIFWALIGSLSGYFFRRFGPCA